MSATAVLNAERIKLVTTRSSLWAAAAVAVLSLGMAAAQASTVYGPGPLAPDKAAMGVAVFGVPVLMILSALTVTNEYRSGMIRTTFLAVPHRTLVLCAKAVVAAVFSGSYAALMVMASIVVAGSDPQSWRLVGSIALYAVFAAVLGVGVGALIRASAGAVALLLLWPLVAEPMLGNLPNISTQVGPYLPFANAIRFTDVQWLYPAYAMPWGEVGSIVYFAAVTAVVFVAGLVMINRRDA
ncbi:ABC transporter permease [Mycolicibacterium agri]|uniref:ABC transporter permease n=1 Tax=Mycolicibacterium agri TaxID=36811 RepID=A0A2A7NGH4_MYCAG|nr:ABC transporter permease [Mycolicibacterium agri]PEG42807.1 ABC transporter permease [Mycolicibacterium agri]GFG52806.1 ABC transporter permease [Mycolicibacterium agri]